MSGATAATAPLMPMGLPLDPELVRRIGWIAAFFLTGYRRMGPVFRYFRDGQVYTVLAGTEANQLVTREGRSFIRAEDYRREQNRELDVEKSLVSLDGAEHRHHRRIQERGYSQAALDGKYESLVRIVEDRVHRWPQGKPVLVREALPPIIAELLGVGVLNHSLGDSFDDVALFVRTVVIETVARTRPRTVLDTGEYRAAKARSLELADRVIEAHRTTPMGGTPAGEGRPDLVDDLLAALEAEPGLMTDQELRLAVLGGYVGGLDTVAYTCAFMLYALLKHPEVLARVQREVDAAFDQGPLSAKTLTGMPALHGAALETLRLYPLSTAIQATLGKTVEFAGFRLEEGGNLIVATTVPHFLDELYRHPLEFDIDRYETPRNEHNRPGAYAPFGLGPHVCLGAGMARVLIMLTLATLLRTVELTPHPPDYELKIGMVPVPVPWDFHVQVRPR